MIRISRTNGRKYISINNKKSLYSNTTSINQYLPYSGRFEPYNSGSTSKATLFISNLSTKINYSIELKFYESNNRSIIYFFDYTTDLFPQNGTYSYQIQENVADASRNSAGVYKIIDTGLFLMYNEDTFIEQYITPDKETIPATITYKPS
ncbi:MAG: hypothetical protein Unbinned6486contig1001_16 [Prokaryotic dsDNA virus sp.]|nr:MAG: hypothetical protein Unbinned6486contig1001_16 [Prokaryotic dsDNA virus sp.]|tara:strand:+ start:295 stop:744 length:450 start_codon:yes stop_codon:yes gene_type:complete